MVTIGNDLVNELEERYDELEAFERIRPQRITPMPVGSARSASKGRRRSTPPKRSHKAPSYCRGAALRRNRKW